MDTSSNGMSPADFSAMMKNDDWGGNGAWWIILFFLILCNGGWGNWNNQGNGVLDATLASSAAQGGYVTSNQLNDALRLQEIQTGQRNITEAVTASEQRLTANQANLLANQASNAQAMQNCCSTINYNGAMNTNALQKSISEWGQKILDNSTANRMADMQNQINQLQMKDALAGVVRYPMASTYSSGCNPFCGCGCTNI